jgi:hypothetical protein
MNGPMSPPVSKGISRCSAFRRRRPAMITLGKYSTRMERCCYVFTSGVPTIILR